MDQAVAGPKAQAKAPAPRPPIETGAPDPMPLMHPLMRKNYGQWIYHDHPRPGVLMHRAANGEEIWTVKAGTQRQMDKLLDYLPDTQNPGPDDQIFEHALTESIEEVLATLKDREAKILRLYFGLEGQDPMTLEEIGSLLGITRERVRQIKEKALARLRHVSRARALESFLS